MCRERRLIRLLYYLPMERMKKPKFIKKIEKSEWKERAKCWRWYIRVYWELDHKPMVELESLEIVVKELHKLEEENKKLESDLEQFSEAYKRYRDFEKEELAESCYDLEKENKKLKETIKDHQLYEEKLEHRIIEFEELLHWE